MHEGTRVLPDVITSQQYHKVLEALSDELTIDLASLLSLRLEIGGIYATVIGDRKPDGTREQREVYIPVLGFDEVGN